MKNFIKNYVKSQLGEYASIQRIHQLLNISASYLYLIVTRENVRFIKKNGRKLYYIEDLLEKLDISHNYPFIKEPIYTEDFITNNFLNWEPKNDLEKFLINLLLDELGEFCSIKSLIDLFNISKSVWYLLIENNKVISFKISNRIVLLTRSLLPLLREAQYNEN